MAPVKFERLSPKKDTLINLDDITPGKNANPLKLEDIDNLVLLRKLEF